MPNEIDPQEFGEMRAQVTALLKSDESRTALLTALAADMQAVRLQLAEARGGWRMLVALGGMSATLGGVVTWFLHEFIKR